MVSLKTIIKDMNITTIESYIQIIAGFGAIFLALGQLVLVSENVCESGLNVLYDKRDEIRDQQNDQFQYMLLLREVETRALMQNDTNLAKQYDKDAAKQWDYMSENQNKLSDIKKNISDKRIECNDSSVDAAMYSSIGITILLVDIFLYYFLIYRRNLTRKKPS